MTASQLDAAVDAVLEELGRRGTRAPQVLLLLGTGTGTLATRLEEPERVPLGKVAGVPAPWREATLHTGRLGEADAWLIEDAPGAADQGNLDQAGDAPWMRAFPVWLAAAAGASACVHTSAGVALARGGQAASPPGTLALVRDHLNLSGRTPLLALGDSQLGPLFPDTSRLHHEGLRSAALAHARRLGVPAAEAIAACVAGPSFETPAERAFWARAGADVAVQDLQNPLLAAAHASLALLACVCVTDAGEAGVDVRSIVQHAEKLAPALEDLILCLAPDLLAVAAAAGVEEA